MKIEQLKAFIAIVETGSFRAAAERLFKTQPTISAAIKSLELEFDIKLFSRDSYRPKLTQSGLHFFKHAKQAISQLDELEKTGLDLAKGPESNLNICISPICMDEQCVDIFKEFSKKKTDISLNISSAHLHGVHEQLELKRAEIALGPRYGLDDHHEIIEVLQIKMVTVVSPVLAASIKLSEASTSNKQTVSQNSLYNIPHVLVSNSATNSQYNEHVHILPSGKRWYVNDYQMKKTLLLAGMGWARIPFHMINHELSKGELVELKIDNFTSSNNVPIFLIRLRNQTITAHAELLWEHIIQSTYKIR